MEQISQNANSPARIDTDTVEVILNFLSFVTNESLFIYTYSLRGRLPFVKLTRRAGEKFFRPTSPQCLCGLWGR